MPWSNNKRVIIRNGCFRLKFYKKKKKKKTQSRVIIICKLILHKKGVENQRVISKREREREREREFTFQYSS